MNTDLVSKYEPTTFWEQFKTPDSIVFEEIQIYIEELCKQIKGDTFEISIITEEGYIDRNFLFDYILYYAKCYDDIPRQVTRFHFFSCSKARIISIFEKLEKNYSQDLVFALNKEYLGYIIKKPIDSGRIGKSILRKYPEIDANGNFRVLSVKNLNRINIFGIPLKLESLPYQEQDDTVSKCATTSLWISLKALEHKFHLTKSYAPAEITNEIFKDSSMKDGRKFPNQGLNLFQILNFFHQVGYDVVTFSQLTDSKLNESEEDFIHHLIKGYLKYSIPIIAILELKKTEDQTVADKHTVVITGYKEDKKTKKLIELYAHDDQVGPYSKIEINDNITDWKDNRINKLGYFKVTLNDLIIPLYPNIRLHYWKIYDTMQDLINDPEFIINKDFFYYTTELTDSNKYKNFLIKKILPRVKEKLKIEIEDYIFSPNSRYLWLISIKYKKNSDNFADYIFDATKNDVLNYKVLTFFES